MHGTPPRQIRGLGRCGTRMPNNNDLFFFVDSNSLSKDKGELPIGLYGYCLIDNAVIRSSSDLANRVPNGDGCYVYVNSEYDKLVIHQDYNGSFGIYLFSQDGYTAISNSFALLVDRVSKDYSLTLNRAYCDYLLFADLCSVSHSETPINEIKILDKRAVIEIDLTTGEVGIRFTDYCEESVGIDTVEGLALLDAWHDKWVALARNLIASGASLEADLSGGFDSRVTLALLASNQTVLENTRFRSIHDSLHTHTEDYRIASSIATSMGFELNEPVGHKRPSSPFGRERTFGTSLFSKVGFHKELFFHSACFDVPEYRFTGMGGENIREYWSMGIKEFIKKCDDRFNGYGEYLQKRFEDATHSIIERSLDSIQSVFNALGAPLREDELTHVLYRETRTRNHFGRSAVESLLSNTVALSPLLDKDLYRLIPCGKNGDRNLLCALIISRYAGNLLGFPFEGGRVIDDTTVALAESINRMMPYVPPRATVLENAQPIMRIAHADCEADVQEVCSKADIDTCLSQAFLSPAFRDLFGSIWPLEVYEGIRFDMHVGKYHPLRQLYGALGACFAQYAITGGADISFWSFLEKGAGSVSDAITRGIPFDVPVFDPSIFPLIAGRIDVEQCDHAPNEGFYVRAYGYHARAKKAAWMARKNREMHVVEAAHAPLRLLVKSDSDAEIRITLRGVSVLDDDGMRIPCWITFTRLRVAGKELLLEPVHVCHDKPYVVHTQIKEREPIEVILDWHPFDVYSSAVKKADYRLREKALPELCDSENRAHKAEIERVNRKHEMQMRDAQKRINQLEHKLQSVRASKAYKVGTALASPIRFLRKKMARADNL